MAWSKGADLHSRRCTFLKDLAVMMGFFNPGIGLPDGRIPDVIRFSKDSRRLFVGDAKATEKPGNIATQVRLLAYCYSIADYLRLMGDEAIFAVCCGRFRDIAGWRDVLVKLTREADLCAVGVRHAGFAPRMQVISLRLVKATRRPLANGALPRDPDCLVDAEDSIA